MSVCKYVNEMLHLFNIYNFSSVRNVYAIRVGEVKTESAIIS